MRKTTLLILLLVISLAVFFGCAAPKKQLVDPVEPVDLSSKLSSGEFIPKVDAFMLIFDASYSMKHFSQYKGRTKFSFAKTIVGRLNQTIPDMDMQSALRSFGHGPCMPKAGTILIQKAQRHRRADFDTSLGQIKCAGGDSPMETAIDAAAEDLSAISGKLALIIVADGEYTGKAPLLAAQNLVKKLGDRVCIYTIQTGDDAGGTALLQKIAQTTQCGYSVNADDIASGPGMAGFVSRVFLKKGEPVKPAPVRLDSDGDGVYDAKDQCSGTPAGVQVNDVGCPLDSDGDWVYDYMDKCPGTPAGAPVDKVGCPLDSDGDGVYDHLDKCPHTPKGTTVDKRGCAADTDRDGVIDDRDKCPQTPMGVKVDSRGCWILQGIQFDSSKWSIRSDMHPILDSAVSILTQNPDLKVEIQGHTDDRGKKAYNDFLSKKRAKAVMEYLIKKGIPPHRLSSAGFGPSKPVASNMTSPGRAQNRRVELMTSH